MSTFSLLASQAASTEGFGIIILILYLALFSRYVEEVNALSVPPIRIIHTSVHTRDIVKKRRGWLAIHEKRDPSSS